MKSGMLSVSSCEYPLDKSRRHFQAYLHLLRDVLILFFVDVFTYGLVVSMINPTCLVDEEGLLDHVGGHESHHVKHHYGFYRNVAQVLQELCSVSPSSLFCHLEKILNGRAFTDFY